MSNTSTSVNQYRNTPNIRRVSRREPCPICGKPDWCNHLGTWGVHCMRVEQSSHKPANGDSGGWIHVLAGHEPDWRDALSAPPPAPKPARRSVDPDTAHRAYTALLARLSLSEAHWKALTARGLTDEQIIRHGYTTSPATTQERQALATAVAEALGCDLAGLVPGFIRRNGAPDLACESGELLIPVRDGQGRTAGIRRRVDRTQDGGKYRWFSAGDGPHSISVDGNMVHIARLNHLHSQRYVVLVEGEIKANIAADRLGCIVISVPGVANIGQVLDTLRALGDVEYVAIAYDADSATNPTVAAAEDRAGTMLVEASYQVCRWVWSLDIAKGLDDLLQAGLMPFALPWSTPEPLDSASDVAEKLAELKRLHALETQARRNFNLGPERHTLTALANVLAASPEGEAVALPYSKVGDQAGVSASTAERQLGKAGIKPKDGEAGLLAGLVAFDVRPVPERIDQRTGQVTGGYDAVHVRRLAPVTDILERIATAPEPATGKRNGHGGKRTPCPRCGCADVRREVVTYCSGCGDVRHREPLRGGGPQDAARGYAEQEQPVAQENEAEKQDAARFDTLIGLATSEAGQHLAVQENNTPSVTVLKGSKLLPAPPPQDAARSERLQRAREDLASRQAKHVSDAPPIEPSPPAPPRLTARKERRAVPPEPIAVPWEKEAEAPRSVPLFDSPPPDRHAEYVPAGARR